MNTQNTNTAMKNTKALHNGLTYDALYSAGWECARTINYSDKAGASYKLANLLYESWRSSSSSKQEAKSAFISGYSASMMD